jgi:hypothetical protein
MHGLRVLKIPGMVTWRLAKNKMEYQVFGRQEFLSPGFGSIIGLKWFIPFSRHLPCL